MKPRRNYSTDFSDEEWEILQPLGPEATPGGRTRVRQTRELLDAIFDVVRGDALAFASPRLRSLANYDGAKKVNGRKRHLLMDTGGLMMKAKVHPADLADREGARVLLERVDKSFPGFQHSWVDAGYRGADLRIWITGRLGLSLEIVQRKPRWV